MIFNNNVEMNAWQVGKSRKSFPDDHPLANSFISKESLEASLYHLFDKVMFHLEPLYNPKNGPEGAATIVTFCSNIQGYTLTY